MMRFKVGSIVVEEGTGLVGIIVKAPGTFIDQDRQEHFWDYEVFFENSEIAYCDDEDLEVQPKA